MDHDFYSFVTHFWWLIFPLFWVVAASFRIKARHEESLRLMEMIKSYTDQGKDPPAALMEALRAPVGRQGDRYVEPYYTHRLWRRAFLFGFLCIAFAVLALSRGQIDPDWPHPGWHHGDFGLIIAAVVMGALCASNIAALLTRPPLPPNRK
jgi:hypothetical protein